MIAFLDFCFYFLDSDCCLFVWLILHASGYTLSVFPPPQACKKSYRWVVGNVCRKKYLKSLMLFLIFNTLSFEGKCCSGRWPTLYGWPSLQNGCRQVRCWKHALFCKWPTLTHYMQLTPEWQDTELQPCWCPGSFHQRLCWRHRTMESGKKTTRSPSLSNHVLQQTHHESWCCWSLTPSSTFQVQCINQPGVLPSSSALKLLPLLVLAALKSPAFRWSQHFVFWKCWRFLSTTAPALAWSWTREARRWFRWSVCLSPAPSRPFTLICTGKYWMPSF